MNKTQLLAAIDELLKESIYAYEVADIQLEEMDDGPLSKIHISLEHVTECLRRARRSGRLLLEEYNDDLSKKPEYVQQDEDEDEDED